jgi:hypothetical protein
MADNKTWQSLKPFVNGGLSGIGATCVIQPLDIVKARATCHAGSAKLWQPLLSPPFGRLPPPLRGAAPAPRRCAQLPCTAPRAPPAARAASPQGGVRSGRAAWTPN